MAFWFNAPSTLTYPVTDKSAIWGESVWTSTTVLLLVVFKFECRKATERRRKKTYPMDICKINVQRDWIFCVNCFSVCDSPKGKLHKESLTCLQTFNQSRPVIFCLHCLLPSPVYVDEMLNALSHFSHWNNEIVNLSHSDYSWLCETCEKSQLPIFYISSVMAKGCHLTF